MHLGIKAKQVFGVTSIVGIVVVILSALHLSRLAQVGLEESRARAELVASAVFHRAREVVVGGVNPYKALAADPGLRSILQSALYSKNVTFAAIVNTSGVAIAHADPALDGQPVATGGDLAQLVNRHAFQQLLAVYWGGGRNLELVQPLLLGDNEIGSIRIGVSTLLIRQDLDLSLRPAAATAFLALGVSVIVATLLSQLLLRPIHVIRSGLTRLGKGEFGVRLDLNQHDEFGELGTFFNTVSAQLSADRSHMADQVTNLESAVQHLEDAVAIVNPAGELLFSNPAMRALVPALAPGILLDQALAPDDALRRLSDETLVSRQSRGPMPARFRDGGDEIERLVMTHPITDPNGDLVGIMLTARNLEYLSKVQSTIQYSRKLVALGRLSAGIAHEVKNPLNAMMIHLELLRQQFVPKPAVVGGRGQRLAPAPPLQEQSSADALEHVDIIANEIRRLDQVVQGFIKFSRPEDLQLQPVNLSALVEDLVPVIRSEADRRSIQLHIDCHGVPDVNGDPTMLRQAFMNLALNACQAMPAGGTLRVEAEEVKGRRVAISFTDTGVGIKPEHLERIFDLYFTTKERGSGIGLSMVFRTVQMHDGEIEYSQHLERARGFVYFSLRRKASAVLPQRIPGSDPSFSATVRKRLGAAFSARTRERER